MECRIMSRRLVGVCRRAANLYHTTKHVIPVAPRRNVTHTISSSRVHRHRNIFITRIPVIRYKQTLASKDLRSSESTSEDAVREETEVETVDNDLNDAQETKTSNKKTGDDLRNHNASVLNGITKSVGNPTNSTNIQSDNGISWFCRPSNHLINADLAGEEVTLFVRSNKQVINFSFRKDARNRRPIATVGPEPLDERPTLDSVQDVRWKPIQVDKKYLMEDYMKLSKIRLTGLVVVTSMAGYVMAPDAFHLSTFLLCTLGTGLQSASANAINQFLEVPYDSQMNRTKNRPIIRGAISPLHAVTFAFITGSAGLAILWLGINPLTAGLGMANLILYTMVYTPMKRLSIANTWLGSIVGAVPPMMGWAACTGQLDPGAWLLGAIMYAWQFPHFNALSWNLRQDYSRAGYRMTSVVNPGMCKRVAFRYCLVITGLCILAPVVNLTSLTFAFDSLPVNAYCCYLGWRFYRDGDSKSSRNLFRFSLLHIPLLIVLMLISKTTHESSGKKSPSGIIENTPAKVSTGEASVDSAKDSISVANVTSSISS